MPFVLSPCACRFADIVEASNGMASQPSVSQAEQTRRLAVFVPAFEQLVGLIHGRVRFPDDYDQWHRDERADFKRHRVAIGDTLLDAACESELTLASLPVTSLLGIAEHSHLNDRLSSRLNACSGARRPGNPQPSGRTSSARKPGCGSWCSI